MLIKGTQMNPYKITTVTDFSLIAKFPEAYFELENDIDFKHMSILHNKNYRFKGSFNGRGHQIINFKTNLQQMLMLGAIQKKLIVLMNI